VQNIPEANFTQQVKGSGARWLGSVYD
jgi:hypothetical protein